MLGPIVVQRVFWSCKLLKKLQKSKDAFLLKVKKHHYRLEKQSFYI